MTGSSRALGVGELAASCDEGSVLVASGLGSCVALIALDPWTRTVGMAHIALPDSGGGAHGPAGRFADTGVRALIEEMQRVGATPPQRWAFKLVGGASVLDPERTFDIGRRNLVAIRRELWVRGLGAVAEDTGGGTARSVRVDARTGTVVVTRPGISTREL